MGRREGTKPRFRGVGELPLVLKSSNDLKVRKFRVSVWVVILCGEWGGGLRIWSLRLGVRKGKGLNSKFYKLGISGNT